MRGSTFTFPAFVVVFCSCAPQEKEPASAPAKDDTEILRQLEYKALSAEFSLDTATIAAMMHDDFVAVYPQQLLNKRQELTGIYNEIVKRRREGETMDSLYLDDFQARLHGNTAIVTFYTVTKGRKKDVPYENRRWRWYDVWIKEREGWKLASVQGTPLQ